MTSLAEPEPTAPVVPPAVFPALSVRLLAPSILLASLLGAGCGPAPVPDEVAEPAAGSDARPIAASPSATPASYAADVLSWQAEREASLERPGGWLSLVGLFWLEEGENTFGGGEGNDLVFPPPAPPRVGAFVLRDGTVLLEPAGAPERGSGGEPELRSVEEDERGEELRPLDGTIRLVPDTEPGTTRLALGSLRFWVIDRGGRLGVRVVDRKSPALEEFEGLEYFPVDPGWRIEARLDRRPGFTVAVPNVLGQVEDLESPGLLVFELDGEERTLAPTWAGEELFIVFADETNGRSTYGGGRFLYADPPDADGRVVLDFNRAYNPPCAFTPYATCPLPPRQNRLEVAVEAGEKAYGAPH